MLLDPFLSPCSRITMWLYMLLQIISRLLAFMLFTLFWGPGNFFPLMIFILIHMVLYGFIHVVFSEDSAYWRNGYYLKFCHNVMLNSFSSIYFHNYIRYDEMPDLQKSKDQQKNSEMVDYQRPGLHISTFLRQAVFDIFYTLEYVVLLAFGFSAQVKQLKGKIWNTLFNTESA